jgi:membrane associated rhomboid family serine protease
VPANVSAAPFSLANLLDVVRSMFLHAGWAHLLGNMLYLYLFGDNIEDRLGWLLYAALYFGSGYVAVLAQVAIDPTSTVVLLGASGAIAGVMGGYLILFPGVRIKGLVPLKNVSFWAEWPAWLVMGLWFVVQLFSGVSSLGVDTGGGGVAFFAHIGGFVFGLVHWVVMIFTPTTRPERRDVQQRASALSEMGVHKIGTLQEGPTAADVLFLRKAEGQGAQPLKGPTCGNAIHLIAIREAP